jgi:site-specific DNA recombinase
VSKSGRASGGERFSKHSLRRLLTNPLYLGKMPYGDELHEGQHEAIVDQTLFDAVGAQMRTHGRDGGASLKNKHGALLKGLVFCAVCESAMQYHYTQRGKRNFSYYVCRKAVTEGAKTCPKSRAPVGELERHVVEQIRSLGRDPAMIEATALAVRADRVARKPELAATIRDHEEQVRRLSSERSHLIKAIERGTPALGERLGEIDGLIADSKQRAQDARDEIVALDAVELDEAALRDSLERFDPVWDELFPKERARILQLLIDRVAFDARSGEVEIRFRTGAPAALGRSA